MAKDIFESLNQPCSTSDLQRLKSIVEGDLSADYEAFLSNSDGGKFKGEVVEMPSNLGHIETHLVELCSVSGKGGVVEGSEAMWSMGLVPRYMLLIGNDNGGNHLFISTKGDQKGIVYYWFHELADSESKQDWKLEQYEALSPMADSFDSFLEKLKGEAPIVFGEKKEVKPKPQQAPPGFFEKFFPRDLVGGADAIQVMIMNTLKTSETVIMGGKVVPSYGIANDIIRFQDFKDIVNSVRSADGKPLLPEWNSVEIKFWKADKNSTDTPIDNLFEGVLVFRSAALEKAKDILEEYGELLALHTEGGEVFYIFRCLNIMDNLHPGARIHDSGNGKVWIKDYWFRPEAIKDAGIFMLPESQFNWKPPIFFTRSAVERLTGAGVRFAKWTTVWDAELCDDGPGFKLL